MVCSSPIQVQFKGVNKSRSFPCGHCTACRIQRTSQWALRLMNELPKWNYDATFITLTYDEEHLPNDYALHKEDAQNFIKRLRNDFIDLGWYTLDEQNRKKANLRYFLCGEYGDADCHGFNGRPHYHAIIFGLPYDKVGRQLVKDNWRLCDETRFNYNPIAKKEQGFAPVSVDDIRYVTGYVQKKYNGKKALEVYGERLPPFQLQSQALGLDFALSHKKEIENGNIKFRGHNVSIPRYYLKKLGIKNYSSDARQHKIEWLTEHGYNVTERPSKMNIIDYAYDIEAQPFLRQSGNELNARLGYKME